MSIYEAKTNSLDMFGELRFKKFFSTDACNENFNGHATGGRIKKLKENIIFTIGDLDHNMYGNPSIPNSKDNAVGKILSLIHI